MHKQLPIQAYIEDQEQFGRRFPTGWDIAGGSVRTNIIRTPLAPRRMQFIPRQFNEIMATPTRLSDILNKMQNFTHYGVGEKGPFSRALADSLGTYKEHSTVDPVKAAISSLLKPIPAAIRRQGFAKVVSADLRYNYTANFTPPTGPVPRLYADVNAIATGWNRLSRFAKLKRNMSRLSPAERSVYKEIIRADPTLADVLLGARVHMPMVAELPNDKIQVIFPLLPSKKALQCVRYSCNGLPDRILPEFALGHEFGHLAITQKYIRKGRRWDRATDILNAYGRRQLKYKVHNYEAEIFSRVLGVPKNIITPQYLKDAARRYGVKHPVDILSLHNLAPVTPEYEKYVRSLEDEFNKGIITLDQLEKKIVEHPETAKVLEFAQLPHKILRAEQEADLFSVRMLRAARKSRKGMNRLHTGVGEKGPFSRALADSLGTYEKQSLVSPIKAALKAAVRSAGQQAIRKQKMVIKKLYEYSKDKLPGISAAQFSYAIRSIGSPEIGVGKAWKSLERKLARRGISQEELRRTIIQHEKGGIIDIKSRPFFSKYAIKEELANTPVSTGMKTGDQISKTIAYSEPTHDTFKRPLGTHQQSTGAIDIRTTDRSSILRAKHDLYNFTPSEDLNLTLQDVEDMPMTATSFVNIRLVNGPVDMGKLGHALARML